MSLKLLVSIAEHGWCGNEPRIPPHFKGPTFGPGVPWRSNEGPHPEPWAFAGHQIGLYGAIRMFQVGQQLKGDTAQQMTSAAERYFDGTCGSVPLSILIGWLLHNPPPPPQPWLDRLAYLANTLAFAEAGEQQQLAAAASRQLLEGLKAIV